MPEKIDPSEPYQRAYYFKRKHRFSEQRLKTAALKGLVRVQVPEALDEPLRYNVADVAGLYEKRINRNRVLLPKCELVPAAGK